LPVSDSDVVREFVNKGENKKGGEIKMTNRNEITEFKKNWEGIIMSLKKLAKYLAKEKGIDIDEALKLLKQRNKNIEVNGYFTAMVMDYIRQDEFNAIKKNRNKEERRNDK